MANIQAVIRYEDGTVTEVWDDMARIEFIENVDKIRKITFYNEAKEFVYDNFRGIPHRVMKGNRDFVTYTGDMAQFIVYNW